MGMPFVNWWCTTIGITDTGAIQIAAGVLGGGSLLFIGFLILTVLVGALLMVTWPETPKGANNAR